MGWTKFAVGEGLAKTASSLSAGASGEGGPKLIVLPSFLVVREDLVGLVYLFEFCSNAAAFVRVMLVREFSVGAFNLVFRRGFSNA